eukprot:1144255-Pelagomonas_calceolata.AAC.12
MDQMQTGQVEDLGCSAAAACQATHLLRIGAARILVSQQIVGRDSECRPSSWVPPRVGTTDLSRSPRRSCCNNVCKGNGGNACSMSLHCRWWPCKVATVDRCPNPAGTK